MTGLIKLTLDALLKMFPTMTEEDIIQAQIEFEKWTVKYLYAKEHALPIPEEGVEHLCNLSECTFPNCDRVCGYNPVNNIN